MSFQLGEEVTFKPKKGKVRNGVVMPGFVDDGMVKVRLEGDPFPVDLKLSQVSVAKNNPKQVESKTKVPKAGTGTTETTRKDKKKMATAEKEKVSAKELRNRCKELQIKGWEDMGRKEMAAAIKAAEQADAAPAAEDRPRKKSGKKAAAKASKKSTPKASKPKAEKAKPAASTPAKKAAAKATKATKNVPEAGSNEALGLTFAKGSTPKPLPEEGANPFRKSSNLHRVAKLLLKGGTRRALAEKLQEQVDLHPYHKDAGDVDLLDYDKRLLLGAQTMRDQFGYGIQRLGRGIDGKILVFRPDGPKDPRAKAKGKSSKK